MAAFPTKREVVRALETTVTGYSRLVAGLGKKQKLCLEATSNVEMDHKRDSTRRMLLAAVVGGVGLLVRLEIWKQVSC